MPASSGKCGLKAARAAGVAVRLDGDDLVLTAAAESTAVILKLLSQNNTTVAILTRSSDLLPDGWERMDERRVDRGNIGAVGGIVAGGEGAVQLPWAENHGCSRVPIAADSAPRRSIA